MSLYIGLMSGTSMDAVDAVLLDLDPFPPEFIATHRHALPPDLRTALRDATDLEHTRPTVVWSLDVQVGELFASAAQALLTSAGVSPGDVVAIGSHGQTIFHAPYSNPPYTVQLGDPNVIAERTGITTVADFRRRDMAAGGQGAPLAPAFHQAMLSQPGIDRCLLNIGGIANITVLPKRSVVAVIGFDTGPGNCLMDAWFRRHQEGPMDVDGQWAASGNTDSGLLSRLLDDEYFTLSVPKSTGTDKFNLAWLASRLDTLRPVPDRADVQRTLCELSVATIASHIKAYAPDTTEVLVCGGGAENPLLMRLLQAALTPITVTTTRDIGFAPDSLEAAAFAWLAKQTLEHRTGNLPTVTGANRAVILGGVYYA